MAPLRAATCLPPALFWVPTFGLPSRLANLMPSPRVLFRGSEPGAWPGPKAGAPGDNVLPSSGDCSVGGGGEGSPFVVLLPLPALALLAAVLTALGPISAQPHTRSECSDEDLLEPRLATLRPVSAPLHVRSKCSGKDLLCQFKANLKALTCRSLSSNSSNILFCISLVNS